MNTHPDFIEGSPHEGIASTMLKNVHNMSLVERLTAEDNARIYSGETPKEVRARIRDNNFWLWAGRFMMALPPVLMGGAVVVVAYVILTH